MENASLFSPANPHFFKPLLSSSQGHFNIPVKFFSEHIEGKHEGKTISLRSDALAKTWKVKMEGQRLTEGWKEFVKAHDLRVGDFLVFRHEGDMLFNVTALGPSCCEIQYALFGSRHKDKEEEEEDETERSDKEIEDNNLPTCFSQYVTVFSMTRDTVSLPTAFAKRNGLYEVSQKIVLMNEGGRSWPSELKKLESGRIVIVRGWTSFCIANKFQVGDSWTFKLLRNAETPVFQLCSRAKTERKKKETLSKDANIAERTDENRFLKLTPTLNSLERGKQHLPISFTSVNDLIKPEKVILVDKNGDEWVMDLKVDNRSGQMCIMSVNGWKSFCAVNEVGAEESLALELILGAASPVLKFCSKMEQSPLEPAEARAHKRARVQTCIPEIRPKLEIREETAEEGEPSHRTRASDKTITNRGNLRETLPSSIPNQLMNKVKHSVLCTLTSIRRFREELKTMEQKLEDSLKDIDNLGNVV